jgi:hypothetical protein
MYENNSKNMRPVTFPEEQVEPLLQAEHRKTVNFNVKEQKRNRSQGLPGVHFV